MGGWVGGSVGQWVGSGQMTNNLINLDLIKIIQFCLKIMICGDTSTYGWVYGWFCGWVVQWVNGWGQVILLKYRINLDLIKIIKFCLKIYDLLRHPHLWVGVWGQWVGSGQMTNLKKA